MARPKGSKNAHLSDWVKLGTKVSPEAAEHLTEMKQRGYLISRVIDSAVLKQRDEPETCKKCHRMMHKFHHCELNPVSDPENNGGKNGE